MTEATDPATPPALPAATPSTSVDMTQADCDALRCLGAAVRARLAADSGVFRLPVDRAEIFAVVNFLSDAECAQFVALIEANPRPSDVFEDGFYKDFRTSWSGDVNPADPFVAMIQRRIDDLLGIDHSFGETIQGQRYQPGQQFKPHHDWFYTTADYWKTEEARGGQRGWTAMAYLNNVEAGGGTWFPHLGISVTPQQGTLIIWNNARPSGKVNEDTLHAGTPVEAGVKYVITKWYRTRRLGQV